MPLGAFKHQNTRGTLKMIETVKECPECGNVRLFMDKERGEVICTTCSFIVEESLVDEGKDSVMGEDDPAKKSRTGAPFDPRVVNNLSTAIGNHADLKKLPSDVRRQMLRLKEKNNWITNSLDQNLSVGLNMVKTIASYLNLVDSIEKESARVYRMAAEKGITRYTSNENLAAACVFIAAKVDGLPKTLAELKDATNIEKKIIAKTYKMVARKLEIRIAPNTPYDFLNRFSSALKLEPIIQTKSVKLIDQMQKLELWSGKNPTSLAATALYLSALMHKTRVTQRQVVEVSGITETTLRSRVKEMVKALKIKKTDLKK